MGEDGRTESVDDTCDRGYFIPDFMIAGTALLVDNHAPTIQKGREGLGANLCRYTGYVKAIGAIFDSAERTRVSP